jgi:single-strand DNA-binding protein
MNINNCVLAGRIVRDVELRYTESGTAVGTFSIAVSRPFKNQKTNEYEADFINAIAFKGRAETIANHFKKGDEIGVVGRWQTRNYENNEGRKIYINELVVESFSFGQKASGNTNTPKNNSNATTGQNGGFKNDPFAGGGSIDIDESDLPF